MKLFSTLTDKASMFNVLKHAIDVFIWDRVLQQHLAMMENNSEGYEVHTEIARGKDMKSMKITITVNPARDQ